MDIDDVYNDENLDREFDEMMEEGCDGCWERQKEVDQLRTENDQLKARVKELQKWKESALSVTPPMQKIAKALDIPLGASIHDKILPAINLIKAEKKMLRDYIRKARDHQTPMGSSFTQWHKEIVAILQEALEKGGE